MTKTFPDRGEITEARKYIIKAGYDHYWRLHDKEVEWIKWGCPVCIAKHEEVEDEKD